MATMQTQTSVHAWLLKDARKLSINQIATLLSITRNSATGFVRKLEDRGLVEMSKRNRIGFSPENVYKALKEPAPKAVMSVSSDLINWSLQP
jgi:Mn-dependent DtxR family transcriptional regulator